MKCYQKQGMPLGRVQAQAVKRIRRGCGIAVHEELGLVERDTAQLGEEAAGGQINPPVPGRSLPSRWSSRLRAIWPGWDGAGNPKSGVFRGGL